jgi:hypothetical protein
MLSSASDPVLSGKVLRELNEAEREETIFRNSSLSVPVDPVDPRTKTDEKVDLRSRQEMG